MQRNLLLILNLTVFLVGVLNTLIRVADLLSVLHSVDLSPSLRSDQLGIAFFAVVGSVLPLAMAASAVTTLLYPQTWSQVLAILFSALVFLASAVAIAQLLYWGILSNQPLSFLVVVAWVLVTLNLVTAIGNLVGVWKQPSPAVVRNT